MGIGSGTSTEPTSGSPSMNNTRAVALSAVIVYALWAVMFAAFIASTSLMAAGRNGLAGALGLTTIVLLGIASVVTVRCYVIRVCTLIRALNGIESKWDVPGLHTVP